MSGSRLRSISPKPGLVVPVLVCCLLFGAVIGVPWLFLDPYETSDHHTITHESTERFDSVPTDDPTPITELSPPAQTVVERGITEYRSSDSEAAIYSVKFCREEMPVCDEVERPDDFTYTSTSSGNVFDVIEANDDVYILKTTDGTIGADPGPFGGVEAKHIIFATVIAPTAGILALLVLFSQIGFTTTGNRTPNRKVVFGLSLYGILVTIVGITDPFLAMYYGFSFSQNFLIEGILLTWMILVATIIHPIFDS